MAFEILKQAALLGHAQTMRRSQRGRRRGQRRRAIHRRGPRSRRPHPRVDPATTAAPMVSIFPRAFGAAALFCFDLEKHGVMEPIDTFKLTFPAGDATEAAMGLMSLCAAGGGGGSKGRPWARGGGGSAPICRRRSMEWAPRCHQVSVSPGVQGSHPRAGVTPSWPQKRAPSTLKATEPQRRRAAPGFLSREAGSLAGGY